MPTEKLKEARDIIDAARKGKGEMIRTVAALYVEPDGPYSNLDGVEVWDEARDARTYAGPHPVVAHPPCAQVVEAGLASRSDGGGWWVLSLPRSLQLGELRRSVGTSCRLRMRGDRLGLLKLLRLAEAHG